MTCVLSLDSLHTSSLSPSDSFMDEKKFIRKDDEKKSTQYNSNCFRFFLEEEDFGFLCTIFGPIETLLFSPKKMRSFILYSSHLIDDFCDTLQKKWNRVMFCCYGFYIYLCRSMNRLDFILYQTIVSLRYKWIFAFDPNMVWRKPYNFVRKKNISLFCYVALNVLDKNLQYFITWL